MKLQSSSGRTLYGNVFILDLSAIEDETDCDCMLYELEKAGIRDGEAYQISNGDVILMDRDAYKKCRKTLQKYGVTVVNQ